MHADLARLLDSVMRRAKQVTLDATLDASVAATVVTDRMGDAVASHTRYADHPSTALQAVLLDAAEWINRQPGYGARIETAWGLPQIELAGALARTIEALSARLVLLSPDEQAMLADARATLARWGQR